MSKEKIEMMRENLIGKTVRIVSMAGEPHYTGRTGVVRHVDDAGQIHGSWGGCAIVPEEDVYEVVKDEAKN